MIFPGDFVSLFVPRGSASPGDLELENIFEDHGVSWLIIDDMSALELETWALHSYATSSLIIAGVQHTQVRSPPACLAGTTICRLSALFSQQLLDLTHRNCPTGKELAM